MGSSGWLVGDTYIVLPKTALYPRYYYMSLIPEIGRTKG